MRSKLLRSAILSFLLISVAVATPVIACYFCKPSPDGMFQFCNPGANRGWNQCTESVRDSFNGNTICVLVSNRCPDYPTGDYPNPNPNDPINRGGGDTGDCYWMIDGECQLYY